MKRIQTGPGKQAVTVIDGATSATFPPATVGLVDHWNTPVGTIPELDLEVYSASAANALTAATLYGGVLHAGTITNDDVDTVDFANNELDIATHGLYTGEGPVRLTTSGTLPAGLATGTDYWIIRVNAGTIQLATSYKNAIDGVAVPFTDAGSGTHTITSTGATDPQRVKWHSYGLLGQAEDGAVTLDANGLAYLTRALHHPRTFCYAFSATFGSAVATSVKVSPVTES